MDQPIVARTNRDGEYTVTLWTSETALDLHCYTTNGMGGWKLDVPVVLNQATRLEPWVLREALNISGQVVGLDCGHWVPRDPRFTEVLSGWLSGA